MNYTNKNLRNYYYEKYNYSKNEYVKKYYYEKYAKTLTWNEIVKLTSMKDIKLSQYMAEVAIKSGNAEFMYNVAIYLKGCPIQKIIFEIMKTNDYKYIFALAKKFKKFPFQELIDKILLENNSKIMCEFAIEFNIDDDLMMLIIDKIILLQDLKCLYYLAKHKILDSKIIDKITNQIILTNDAMFMYYFAIDVKNVSINKMLNAIISTNNINYINKYIEYIKEELQMDYKTILDIGKNYKIKSPNSKTKY